MIGCVCMSVCLFPLRAHHHVVGDDAVYVSDINQPSLPTPFFILFFYSVLVSVSVFMAFSTVFYFINSPDNPPLSHSVLPISFLLCWSFSTTYISLCESLLQP